MELKTPTKKGIKTPRYRPPLPMLNDSGSGLCVDEYDWPLFTGYYNGNSVIVDDSQAMTLLTNKGFFGKGSLSKGCPNLSKRKIPNSVVYESQWKRRKMWIESLNNLLESKKKCNETLNEGDVDEIENKKSDVAEKLEVESESNGIIENKTEQESSNPSERGNENSQNKSNDTSKENSVDTENEKSNEVEKKDSDNEEKSLVGNDLSRTEEESSTKNGNEGSENDSNETSKDNVVDTEDKKRDDVEKMEVDNEKNNTLSDSSKEEIPPNTSGCDEIKNNSYEASQENIVDINNKINDSEKKETGSTENNLCNPDEEPSKTSTNEGNGDGSASTDAVVETTQKTNETESQKELCESEKNENNLKDNERIEVNDVAIAESTSSNVINIESKCVRKINPSSNPEKGTLNINEVLVIPDIDGELEQYFHNLKPHIEEEKVKTAIEVLYLSLEEAFFLSYCCNCLQIFDLTSNILRIKDMWVLFQESQPDFIEKYVAYHYFRAKGWVVKSGTKFGGDFLLYKKGPLYFHASYIVIVEVIKNNENSRSKITWQKIVGMNRMAESANKEILICHVLWPDVEKGKFNDPGILKEFGVSETLLRRWQATHEKTP